MWSFLYNFIIYPLIRFLIVFIVMLSPKLRHSIQGKKGLEDRLQLRLRERDHSRPLIWFHAPSAGEFIQLQPLLETFLNRDYDCIVTYNSISAQIWISKFTIKAKKAPLSMDFLPFDSRRKIKNLINLVKPSCLVFVKYDLWPNMIWETAKAGIPLYLTSATLHTGSGRFRTAISRSFFANLYSHFTAIFVVSDEDRKRFLETTSKIRRIEVIGDTRYDATIAQRERRPLPFLPSEFHSKPVFIVGSSWPPDEAAIFPALKKALQTYPDLRLIIAPHEPTEKHLENSELFFADFHPIRFSQLKQDPESQTSIILIDSVGILSSLYPVGLMAYIGGGFTTGVHNVMEPCSTGMPVFFGPSHSNSGEALQLAKDHLAFPISGTDGFNSKLFELLKDMEQISHLGSQAKAFIESQSGATEKCFQAITRDLLTSENKPS
jgi:3-deoxy-D-manno-octulosonic-acid transferase